MCMHNNLGKFYAPPINECEILLKVLKSAINRLS